MNDIEIRYTELTLEDKKNEFINSFFDKFNNYFGVSKEELSSYYDEDIYSGYPHESSGSIFELEGKSIYCFIRCLKPKKIIELGNYKGVSSNHILQAVEKNGFGDVVLLDIEDYLEYDKLHNRNFNRIISNSLDYLNNPLDFDCLIQDNCHEYIHVKSELELITKNTTVNFHIWSHDYFKNIPDVCEVKRAWDEVSDKFYDVYTMIDNYSNCGFLIAKYDI